AGGLTTQYGSIGATRPAAAPENGSGRRLRRLLAAITRRQIGDLLRRDLLEQRRRHLESMARPERGELGRCVARPGPAGARDAEAPAQAPAGVRDDRRADDRVKANQVDPGAQDRGGALAVGLDRRPRRRMV